MRKIGILGGMAYPSTIAYYRGILEGYKKITSGEEYPQFFINSLNITEMLRYVADKNYEKLTDFLYAGIKQLESAGSDYIAIASNTPHIVADDLIKKTSVPIISIVEETCKHAKENNLNRVLLTGTIFTMKETFYQRAFAKYNIECIVPDDNEKNTIQNIIFPDLENGVINEKDKKIFLELCSKIIAVKNIDGIILGCTELPLLVKASDFNIPVLDTMEIHINSILQKMI
jgi:aspartate racemase